MSRAEANKWLWLLVMLDNRYKSAVSISYVDARDGPETSLRMLKSQEARVVFTQPGNKPHSSPSTNENLMQKILGFSPLYIQV
ncbi:hypothetical protein HanHA300_Chr04g0156401 [Helianthus annuus]|nr:hypothetical protein HanHA300_Chr04g0156401 [Helianthus annuus]